MHARMKKKPLCFRVFVGMIIPKYFPWDLGGHHDLGGHQESQPRLNLTPAQTKCICSLTRDAMIVRMETKHIIIISIITIALS